MTSFLPHKLAFCKPSRATLAVTISKARNVWVDLSLRPTRMQPSCSGCSEYVRRQRRDLDNLCSGYEMACTVVKGLFPDKCSLKRRGDHKFDFFLSLRTFAGYFLFLNTSKIDPAHPESRVYFSTRKPTPATCVTFWWKGFGYRSDLNVYV